MNNYVIRRTHTRLTMRRRRRSILIVVSVVSTLIAVSLFMWSGHEADCAPSACPTSPSMEEYDEVLSEDSTKNSSSEPEASPVVELELEPKGDKSKTYMDYRAITNKSSNQWKLLQTLNFDNDGFIRDEEGYIGVALGSYFGPIGSRWVFYLKDGTELPVIKVDQKQDKHTCKDNIYGLNNWDIIEFVVDSSKMPKFANGYAWGGNLNNNPLVAGEIYGWKEITGCD